MNPRRAAWGLLRLLGRMGLLGLMSVHVVGCTATQNDGNAIAPPPTTGAPGATASATSQASGSSSSGPFAASASPPARDLHADVERLMALLAEVSAIHIRALPSSARATPPPGKTLDERLAGEPNCSWLTEQLDAWERAHGAELRAIPALTYGAVEREPITKQHMHNQMEAVMTIGMKCRSHPDFQALQQRLLAAKP